MANAEVNFITRDSLMLIGGATLAVSVIANTIQILSKRQSPWFAFAASTIVTVAIGLNTQSFGGIAGILLMVANACLLFCTASGIQSAIARTPQPTGEPGAFTRDADPGWWKRNVQPWFVEK